METLRRHEYDIPLVTVGHRDGLVCMFSDFWLLPLFLSFDPKCKGIFRGLKQHFQSKIIKFHRISRTGEAVQGLSSYNISRYLVPLQPSLRCRIRKPFEMQHQIWYGHITIFHLDPMEVSLLREEWGRGRIFLSGCGGHWSGNPRSYGS